MDLSLEPDETCDEFGHIDDTLQVAAKNWNRMTNAAEKTGYREGRDEGSETVFQEGFDNGYEEAFRTAFILGKFKSLLNAMPQDTQHSSDILEILNMTKRGACYVCEMEKHNQDYQDKTLSEIVCTQREHSRQIIQRLFKYFKPIIQKSKINIHGISEYM